VIKTDAAGGSSTSYGIADKKFTAVTLRCGSGDYVVPKCKSFTGLAGDHTQAVLQIEKHFNHCPLLSLSNV